MLCLQTSSRLHGMTAKMARKVRVGKHTYMSLRHGTSITLAVRGDTWGQFQGDLICHEDSRMDDIDSSLTCFHIMSGLFSRTEPSGSTGLCLLDSNSYPSQVQSPFLVVFVPKIVLFGEHFYCLTLNVLVARH